MDIMGAMAWQESACGKYLHGERGEIGLFQVKLSTARDIEPGITKKQLLNHRINFRIAKKYFDQKYTEFGGSLIKALDAYNRGSRNVRRTKTYKNEYPGKIIDRIYKKQICNLEKILWEK